MTVTEAVKRARKPQEAMLALAHGIDEILAKLGELSEASTDEWNAWGEASYPPGGPEIAHARTLAIEQDEDTTTITLAPVSEEKKELRRRFAESALKLDEALPELGQEAIEYYAKGGPVWLYYGNRELFMQYAPPIRALMVSDIDQDDPITAQEIGRDVLKDADTGVSPGFAEEVFYNQQD